MTSTLGRTRFSFAVQAMLARGLVNRRASSMAVVK